MIEVRVASGPAEVEAALQLRYRVFCEEQGVTLAADQDSLDPAALHILALEDGRLVGTCRVVFDDEIARLGRMAVDPAMRRRGVGAAILDAAESESRAARSARIRLDAQTAARGLYERAGFEALGEEFVDEGIPHVTMEKALA